MYGRITKNLKSYMAIMASIREAQPIYYCVLLPYIFYIASMRFHTVS